MRARYAGFRLVPIMPIMSSADGRAGVLPPMHRFPSARRLLFAGVVLEGRAGAHDVAIAVRVVDAADRGPVLVGCVDGGRERRLVAAIGPRPRVGGDVGRGVGRTAEGAVVERALPRLDTTDLVADREHRVAEAV